MTISDTITTTHSLYYSNYILLEDKIIKIKNIEDFSSILRI